MPRAPLPPPLEQFLSGPRPAVVAVVGSAGEPVSTTTWYMYEGGRVVLSMARGGLRHSHLLADPRLSLTVLADEWYSQVTVIARVLDLRDDTEFVDIDRISRHYVGEAYHERDVALVTAVAAVERWHKYGNPG